MLFVSSSFSPPCRAPHADESHNHDCNALPSYNNTPPKFAALLKTLATYVSWCSAPAADWARLVAQHVIIGVPLVPRLRGRALQALQPGAMPPALLVLLHLRMQPQAALPIQAVGAAALCMHHEAGAVPARHSCPCMHAHDAVCYAAICKHG